MRLIDADVIDKQIGAWIGQPGYGDYYTKYDNALCAIRDLIADMPTLTPPNEPLTCEGCYWKTHGSFGQCFDCVREKQDNYRRPPEGEEGT